MTKFRSNRYTGATFQGNVIAKINRQNGVLTLDTKGRFSETVRQAMNDFLSEAELPYEVRLQNGEWVLAHDSNTVARFNRYEESLRYGIHRP